MSDRQSSVQAQQRLCELFTQWSGTPPTHISPIAAHASARRYYRLSNQSVSAIGAFHLNTAENNAFISYSKHLKRQNIPVPDIYAQDLTHNVYLQQDLGDESLFERINRFRSTQSDKNTFSKELIEDYQKVLRQLPVLQVQAASDIDYQVATPKSVFDADSIQWDMNYFKYHFLTLAKVQFDELALEQDFQQLKAFLTQAPAQYFMHRDFQSRNIMWYQDQPYFIDYQNARRGALQYDLASLLMDGKANIPWPVRQTLLNDYLKALETCLPIERETFMQYFVGFGLIRVMQAMGAYGLRGLHEGKTLFVQSIPFGIKNLEWLATIGHLPFKTKALDNIFEALKNNQQLRTLGQPSEPGTLQVAIESFSYHRGLPRVTTGQGGGFVFDCRILLNPGRQVHFKDQNGTDPEVIDFLQALPEVDAFLEHCKKLVDQAIEHHQRRRFDDLAIGFGCTGGQHRSVYCAQHLKAYLTEHYPQITVNLFHREQDHLN